MAATQLSTADRRQIEARGIDPAAAERQLSWLRTPPPRTRLVSACRPGKGILRLPEKEHEALLTTAGEASMAGRVSKMVPASGAASRMFEDLSALLHGEKGESARAAGQRFLTNLKRFPFHRDLLAAAPQPLLQPLLQAALSPTGLDLARRPKALLPFHLYSQGPRTAFAEHLVEAAGHIADEQGICRIHFTVSQEHRPAFEEELETQRGRLEAHTGCTFRVSFSHQSPATDTLALAADGQPFRHDDGRLLFRPGGHGALLHNLGALANDSANDPVADLVAIKNIDNIVPDGRRDLVLRWKNLLTGTLVRLQEKAFAILRGPKDGEAEGDWLARNIDFLIQELAIDGAQAIRQQSPRQQRAFLRRTLDRPMRVCGMVPNTGEPGGGPFMVRAKDGSVAAQIVESSQIDRGDPEQQAILAQATHFNPVDLVCALRDHTGRAFDLNQYVDPSTIFVSQKSAAGKELWALEHPGLWNGAMAHWLTVFVEVPAETFAPVKTLFDLLRPEHQARSES